MTTNPYAPFLGGREPREVIEATAGRLKVLLEALGAERVELAPAPGKWSARQILCHLADCEIVFAFRLRQALSQDDHVIQPFDQDRWAARYASYDFAAALRLFEAMRGWNILLIDGVGSAERQRPTSHPERGTMPFWTIVETMAGHDINHSRQIGRLLVRA